MKTCSKCRSAKPLDAFHKQSSARSGYASACKSCTLQKLSQKRTPDWYTSEYSRNREATLARGRANYARNKAQVSAAQKTYREVNSEAVKKRKSDWAKENAALRLASVVKRNADKANATPPWFDERKVQDVYDLAKEFREFGIDVHVDHIVPLKGVHVSGLHVHNNLRVCLAKHNLSKGNRMTESFNE